MWLQLAAKAGKGDDGDDWGELEVALWLGPKDHVLGRISEDHASEPDGLPVLSTRCIGKQSTLRSRAPVMSDAGGHSVYGAAAEPQKILAEIEKEPSGVQGLLCLCWS